VETIYEYKSNFYSDERSERIVCQGGKSFVENFILQKEFEELFGGFILSGNLESGEEFLGVWGRRRCQNFRRLLRERGAEFKLLKNLVPKFRRVVTSWD
jgi:hypothetical protein